MQRPVYKEPYTDVYTYIQIRIHMHMYVHAYVHVNDFIFVHMGWLRWVGSLKLYVSFAKEPYKRVYGVAWLVGSLKLYVSFAKEPYKRDDILQENPIILRIY